MGRITPAAPRGPVGSGSAGGHAASARLVDAIVPVVLVGGRSQRFGRDKLLEPWGDPPQPLVSHPIAALREVFGARVCLVGACNPRVAMLGDRVLADPNPGVGPIGGILSALLAAHTSILVLAGDMPRVDAAAIRILIAAASVRPEAEVLVARAENRTHPCVGIFRLSAVAGLRAAFARGERALHLALQGAVVQTVDLPPSVLANINTPEEFHANGGARRDAANGRERSGVP